MHYTQHVHKVGWVRKGVWIWNELLQEGWIHQSMLYKSLNGYAFH